MFTTLAVIFIISIIYVIFFIFYRKSFKCVYTTIYYNISLKFTLFNYKVFLFEPKKIGPRHFYVISNRDLSIDRNIEARLKFKNVYFEKEGR